MIPAWNHSHPPTNAAHDAMAPFKVIIVGGSITGLALANMLEQYGIDFVVLEKHNQIAPQLGAGFGIWPNGARILDQLGCYEALEKVNEPVNSIVGYDGDGINRVNQPEIGDWMQELYVSMVLCDVSPLCAMAFC